MKKIFSIAIALVATIGVAEAQDYDMYVSKNNGEVIKYRVENIKDITYVERPDGNVGWTSLGYCHYGEDFVGSAITIDYSGDDLCTDYYVEVQEKDDEPGLYRLVNPYSPEIYPFAQHTTYDIENDYYVEINACDPDAVYVELQDTGMSWNTLGEFYVWSLAMYYYKGLGYNWDLIKSLGYFGSLKDGVITFPQSVLASYLPEYSMTTLFYGNVNNRFILDLNDTNDEAGVNGVKGKRTSEQKTSINMNNLLTIEEGAEIKLEK